MKILAICLLFFMHLNSYATPVELKITTDIYQNLDMPFHTYAGTGEYDSFLAMNIQYAQVEKLRTQIEDALHIKLDYLRSMNPAGEAHVTVVTPVEYHKVLKEKLSIDEINKIALRYDIQDSRIMLLGVGSAKKLINETFFLIVDSENLRNIRQQIFYEFTRRGGDRNAFDPTWFFPHITIGYIGRDLHESDGVLKNLKYSYDPRFKLKFIYSK